MPDGCRALSFFPNATVAEYGRIHNDTHAIQAEIFARGPVKASIDAGPLVNYARGVIWDSPAYHVDRHNHGVSIVGWGYDAARQKQYWIVRNSWGEYWYVMLFCCRFVSVHYGSLSLTDVVVGIYQGRNGNVSRRKW